ncbi:MAG TPA: sugar phosphate isomerase/epimerase [Gemmatimonadaceae bacterium]|nr:sugar phosphate isomerase/epimerase [Gemmatimonadaceae bacterium]
MDRSDAAALSRREFLLASGAMLVAPRLASACSAPVTRHSSLSRIGVQLYTVRSSMQQGVERTLEEVARIGYKEVEFAGYFGRTPQQIRSLLDANGLTAPSSHGGDLNTIRTRWAQALEEAQVVGHRYLVCASLPRSEQTADGYQRVAAEFNRAGAEAARAGITLAYHNHDFEFRPLGDTIGYDILLAECDPKLVLMQMDLFWIAKGGRDPLAYFAKHPGRFYSVHVKDMDASGAMVDVGAGQLPFARYFAQAEQAGIRHYFVEHDNPGDPMASIRASYDHLARLPG